MTFTERIASPLRKTLEVVRQQGLGGLAIRVRGRTYGRLRSFLQRKWPQVQGRVIELIGDRWRIEGVSISVNNPYIARGDKWQVLGAFERAERSLLRKHLDLDAPVIELGGCLGVIACIVNRRLVHPERHVVVEAHPGLLPTLQVNRDINKCRFQIVPAAIAYEREFVAFHLNPGFASGSTFSGKGEAVSVPARTLATIAEDAGFEQFDLICDIEGTEAELVAHEGTLLQNRVRWLFIEIHDTLLGTDGANEVRTRLRDLGFRLEQANGSVFCYRRTKTS